MSVYLLPIFILLTFVYAKIKNVNVYNSFISGAKQSVPLVVSLLPYIATIMIMVEFIKISGLASLLANLVSPVFSVFSRSIVYTVPES